MGSHRSQKQLNRYRDWILSGGKLDCGICLLPITNIKDLTVDHIIPRARWGRSRQDNMQPAHSVCNNQKGSKLIMLPPYKVTGQRATDLLQDTDLKEIAP